MKRYFYRIRVKKNLKSKKTKSYAVYSNFNEADKIANEIIEKGDYGWVQVERVEKIKHYFKEV